MRNLIRTSAFLILALLATSCEKKYAVLNLIQAPNGQVVGNEKEGYKLILEESNDTVIWFADRPIREAGSLHISNFLKTWDKGEDSFKKDPPNAVLIIDNSEPIVVELILADWNEKRATFEIKSLKGQKYTISEKSGPVTLFIDYSLSNEDVDQIRSLGQN